jgi:hypothetical protein
MMIDGVLRSHLTTEVERHYILNFQMGHTRNPTYDHLYTYSDIKVKYFTTETFRALPVTHIEIFYADI